MGKQDTWAKANQITTLAKLGGMIAFEDGGQPLQVGDFIAYFEVIQSLAEQVADEIEGMEREHQIGSFRGRQCQVQEVTAKTVAYAPKSKSAENL